MGGRVDKICFEFILFSVNGFEVVVIYFVYKIIEEDLRIVFVNMKFFSGSVVIMFFDVLVFFCVIVNMNYL